MGKMELAKAWLLTKSAFIAGQIISRKNSFLIPREEYDDSLETEICVGLMHIADIESTSVDTGGIRVYIR